MNNPTKFNLKCGKKYAELFVLFHGANNAYISTSLSSDLIIDDIYLPSVRGQRLICHVQTYYNNGKWLVSRDEAESCVHKYIPNKLPDPSTVSQRKYLLDVIDKQFDKWAATPEVQLAIRGAVIDRIEKEIDKRKSRLSEIASEVYKIREELDSLMGSLVALKQS